MSTKTVPIVSLVRPFKLHFHFPVYEWVREKLVLSWQPATKERSASLNLALELALAALMISQDAL